MKFIGLLSLLCVFCLTVTLFTASEAKIRKIKIAKKIAKLLLLKGALHPKVIMALPLPLPVPIPIVRKTVQNPISNSGWEVQSARPTTTYEIPSFSSLPESILNLLRPALNSIAATAALRGNNAWSTVNSLPLDSWSPPMESWPSSLAQAPVQQNAWPSSNNVQQQQQQEVVEQQQTNNYA